jgi:hypothetical protein
MDIVKELREIVLQIRAGLDDGRITPIEALRIAKEVADLIYVLYQVFAAGVKPWASSLEEKLGRQGNE